MRNRRAALAVTMLTVLAIGAVSPTAEAGVPGETLYGDFNSDGVVDAAVLGSISPNLCSTVVEYGSAPGVYLPPIAYTYLQPNGGGTPNCPDIGVALNVDGDPADELWLGWSLGAPATVSFNRLVLQPPTFAPSAFHTSMIARPSLMGKGMFAAGGRFSPYDVGPGGVQNFVIHGADVAPGPVAHCTVDTPSMIPSDFNRDGIDGLLLTYQHDCADNSSGVLRIRHEGSVAQILQNDPTGRTTWVSRVVNANDDRWFDVRTVNQATSEVDYFINETVGTDTLLVRAPDANSDRVALASVKPLAIDVLDNDFASRYVEVSIATPPRYGTVQVQGDDRIVYRPNPRHGRTDRFTYQLTEEGKKSLATVSLTFPT
ncbi:hypothetical protein I0C86_31560 [Plantactinospora sp. S1510]|uniref:VCBS repeat-containing protein n=1 Tax=Plantactinospora alkalitolerans TaxID=2789879 RepID=A0ABS0H5J1_9ACTN|nr:Ig-like domain-containing protein [Plantactinospora alkalitolerans]MBF9133463.1 hypothetical protein [Plantactinospora alkalitolerans]